MGEDGPADVSRDPSTWPTGYFGRPEPRPAAVAAVAPVVAAVPSAAPVVAADLSPTNPDPVAPAVVAEDTPQGEAPAAPVPQDAPALGAVVEDCGELIPAAWGDDDPRFARLLVVSRKQLAAADIARGRNTAAAAEAISNFPGEIPDDTWGQDKRKAEVCQDLMRRGRADLEMARNAFRSLGFDTCPSQSFSRQDAFLVVAWSGDSIKGVAEWDDNYSSVAHWMFQGGPDIGRLSEADCYAEDVPIAAFRELQPVPHWPQSLVLRVDAIDQHDATDSDATEGWNRRQNRHPADVTWQIRVPATFKLAPGETARAMRERVPRLPESMQELWDTWESVGDDLQGFLSAVELHRDVTSDEPTAGASVPQLVKGLLPAGMVAVLVGESGSGKSTFAHQLAAAIGGGAAEFLGYEIPPERRGGGVAIIAGEDVRQIVTARARRFNLAGLPHPRSLAVKVRKLGLSLADMLADLEKVPNLRLVVVDPAAVWLAGKEEDSSGGVGDFINLLMDFAQRTGACVLVVHHPRKGRGIPLGQLLDAIRGSGVWIDRPRLILGLVKGRGEQRTLGVIKSNLAPDISKHSVRLEGDEESTLLRPADDAAPVQGGHSKAAQAQPQNAASAVLAAVAALRALGERVNRTGDLGLFKRQPPPLPGWSRTRIKAGQDAALAAGLLVDGRGGMAPPE